MVSEAIIQLWRRIFLKPKQQLTVKLHASGRRGGAEWEEPGWQDRTEEEGER